VPGGGVSTLAVLNDVNVDEAADETESGSGIAAVELKKSAFRKFIPTADRKVNEMNPATTKKVRLPLTV
jgi:hypothetical protein